MKINDVLTELQHYLHHDPRCIADQYFSEACNCGLRRTIEKIIRKIKAEEK